MSKVLNVLCRVTCIIVVLCLMYEYPYAQSNKRNKKMLPRLLKHDKSFNDIVQNPDVYEVQIIYTKIIREKGGINFIDYHYNVDNNRYFYPSTAVFLPVAALTLEKINELSKKYDIDKSRYVRIDNPLTQKILIYQDTTSDSKYASFEHFIKKMFVVGDKSSCDFCYDFLNQRHLNERMHSLGYNRSWFLNKFDRNPPVDSRQTNVVTFFRTDVQSYYIDIIYLKRHPTIIPFYSIYVKESEYNPVDYYSNRAKIRLGKGFVRDGTVVDSAADFTFKNEFAIEDMHSFLKTIIFPDVYKNKLDLSGDDYAFLYKQMANNNKDHNYILNDRLGDTAVKIFNNPGKGAGFMIDNAYVIDTRNGVDFFLTVVIKCNKTNILSEEHYDYETTGLSFMKNIGRLIHDYEINKKEKTVNFDDFLNKIK